MRKAKEMTKMRKGKRLVHAFAAAVLAGSLFLGTGVTAEAAKVDDVLDTQAYADRYPDLFAAFGNNATALLKHYKEHGIDEKREVEGLVDVVRYREANPDLDAAFGDDWDAYVNHYLEFGAKEGRENFTDFDGLAYAARYPDLKEAFGDDVLALYKHYQAFGKDEGRDAYEEPEETDVEDEVYTFRYNYHTGTGYSIYYFYNEADANMSGVYKGAYFKYEWYHNGQSGTYTKK